MNAFKYEYSLKNGILVYKSINMLFWLKRGLLIFNLLKFISDNELLLYYFKKMKSQQRDRDRNVTRNELINKNVSKYNT